jgi:antitoxin PrlF
MELGAGISGKGQVTVPKKVRDALGLRSGDHVYFVSDGEKALMIPSRGSLLGLRGILKIKFGFKARSDFKEIRAAAKQAMGRAYARKHAGEAA